MASVKSTWWSVTAFNEDIQTIQGEMPAWVRAVYGGLEECPKTGTKHFQGAVQARQQIRMVQLKQWLPKAHLEPARSAEALKKYAMKEETSAGEKTVRENSVKFYSADKICLLLAEQSISQTDRQTDNYWPRVRAILKESPELAGQLMNPTLKGFYTKTASVWEYRVAIVLQQRHKHSQCRPDTCRFAEESEEECPRAFQGPPAPERKSSPEV